MSVAVSQRRRAGGELSEGRGGEHEKRRTQCGERFFNWLAVRFHVPATSHEQDISLPGGHDRRVWDLPIGA